MQGKDGVRYSWHMVARAALTVVVMALSLIHSREVRSAGTQDGYPMNLGDNPIVIPFGLRLGATTDEVRALLGTACKLGKQKKADAFRTGTAEGDAIRVDGHRALLYLVFDSADRLCDVVVTLHIKLIDPITPNEVEMEPDAYDAYVASLRAKLEGRYGPPTTRAERLGAVDTYRAVWIDKVAPTQIAFNPRVDEHSYSSSRWKTGYIELRYTCNRERLRILPNAPPPGEF